MLALGPLDLLDGKKGFFMRFAKGERTGAQGQTIYMPFRCQKFYAEADLERMQRKNGPLDKFVKKLETITFVDITGLISIIASHGRNALYPTSSPEWGNTMQVSILVSCVNVC